MSSNRVTIICHWGGNIVNNNQDGVNYVGGEQGCMRVKPDISFRQLVSKMYILMGIDRGTHKIKMTCRFPDYFDAHCTFTTLQIVDNASVEAMLCAVVESTRLACIHLYVEIERVANDVCGNVSRTTSVHVPLPIIPVDAPVLYLQAQHRSSRIWDSIHVNRLRIFHNEGSWRRKLEGRMDDRVLRCLVDAGFYGAYCVGFRSVDWDLIEALVERWREETHTFHLPVGECTITLQDVEVLYGLPVDGIAVTNAITLRGDVPVSVWVALCYELLGFIPDESKVKGARVCVSEITKFLRASSLDETTSIVDVHQHARCYIMLLLGSLFGDQSGTMVNLIYLPLLRDLSRIPMYSWGSVVLAYLYRELCTATLPDTSSIGGALLLVQYWAWERLLHIRPEVTSVSRVIPPLRPGFPAGPRGQYWSSKQITQQNAPAHSLVFYRDALDQMQSKQMSWEPYYLGSLPSYCTVGSDVWTTRSPLINFHIVEFHYGDRVLRQFGMRQNVSNPCNTDKALHLLNRRGKQGENWANRHMIHIRAWEARRENVQRTELASPLLAYYDPYMVWYRNITRIRVGPLQISVPAIGYQPIAYIRNALTNQVVRVSALSQDAMHLEQSSQYQQTLQQIHDESLYTLEHLGQTYRIPPPRPISTQDAFHMDPQRPSPLRQVPSVFAEASSSQGGASVSRGLHNDYHGSTYACPESASPDNAEHIHSSAPPSDDDPTQEDDNAQNDREVTLGGVDHPRSPRTRGGRVNQRVSR